MSKGNNVEKMENSNEEGMVMKSRSSQSCIRLGYSLYLSNFRKIFKAAWLPALLYAICFSVIVTMGVIQYPRLNISVAIDPGSLMSVLGLYRLIFLIFIVSLIIGGLAEIFFYSAGYSLLMGHKVTGSIARPTRWIAIDRAMLWRALKGMLATFLIIAVVSALCVALGYLMSVIANKSADREMVPAGLFAIPLLLIGLLVTLPVAFPMYKYIFTPGAKYWQSLAAGYVEGMRHYGMLFITLMIGYIVVMIVSAVILLPAHILSLANFQANIGMLYGDPLGMPDYIVTFTVVIMLIAGFAEAFIRMTVHFLMYYVYGSIETQEEERRKFKARQEAMAEEAVKASARYIMK